MGSSGFTVGTNRTKTILIADGVLVILIVVLGVAIGVPLSKRSSGGVAEEVLEAYPLIDG